MTTQYALSFLFILSSFLVYLAQARSFQKGQPIPLLYTKIFSQQTQLPYTYASLPFICPPYTQESWHDRSLERTWLTLDQDITGDRPVKSDYKITTLETTECSILCTQPWTVSDAMVAKDLIQNDYQVEWWLDDIPGATASYTNEISTLVYRVGYPLGQIIDGNTFINNHVTFNILYSTHEEDPQQIYIIGFEVYPESMKSGECQRKTIDHEMQQVTDHKTSVTFTYAVKWKHVQQVPRPSPWDMFLILPNPDTYFIASINMAVMILLLSFVIAVIMVKTLKKDVSVSHDEIHDDFEDVIGWRLVHRDVFRRPMYGGLLAPMVGTGLQLFLIAMVIIGCVYKGYVHPTKPGSLISLFIKLYVPSCGVAGYWSSRIYKVFRGKSWTFNAVLTSTMLPGFIALGLFTQSFFAWSVESSLAISFRGWVCLVLLWFGLVFPLTLLGGYIGDRRERIDHPVRTTQMPRLIPNKRWYQQYSISIFLGGVIPFAMIFVDLNELLKSSWHGELYVSIPHVVLAGLVMAITTSQVSVILIFFQLCSEDYHWWWMSFMIGASSSVYMFVYGLIYYMTKTNIDGIYGGVIYVIRLLLGSVFTGLSTGSLGFFSAYWMIRRIYSSAKTMSPILTNQQPHSPSPLSSPPRSSSPTHHDPDHPDRSTEWLKRSRQPTVEDSITSLLARLQTYLSDLDGRDKSMKIIQYGLKVLLHYRRVELKRWSPIVSHLSQTRKLLRVGHWIGPFKDVLSPSHHSLAKMCTLFIVLANRVADDLFCFHKLGVLGPWIGKKAERAAVYCWFLGIWIDLRTNFIAMVDQQRHPGDQAKLFLAKISCVKLIMDAIFCACDVWKPTFSSGVQAWSGFCSGFLAGYKLWCTK